MIRLNDQWLDSQQTNIMWSVLSKKLHFGPSVVYASIDISLLLSKGLSFFYSLTYKSSSSTSWIRSITKMSLFQFLIDLLYMILPDRLMTSL